MKGFLIVLVQNIKEKKYNIRWHVREDGFCIEDYREEITTFNERNSDYFVALPYPVASKSELIVFSRCLADSMQLIQYTPDRNLECPRLFNDFEYEEEINAE